jgi:anaerobic nitric oxide reductase flavorubredoxin
MKISDKIRYVGIYNEPKNIFENQWPLPYGVTYNSYLVVDQKIALIDTAAAAYAEQFIEHITEEIGDRAVDYLVVNHMEPDHSALMSVVRKHYPQITIICSAKAVPMIEGFQGIVDNIHPVADGDVIDLGDTTLEFHLTPMVHWPETMMTYCPQENTLFSGDGFGAFGTPVNGITDATNAFKSFKDEMIRYYSNIVGKYGVSVQAALKKLSGLQIKRICSTHGPVWERETSEVVSLYDRMSKYETDKGVCIVYGSMYGNTQKAAEALAQELSRRGVPFVIHNIDVDDVSYCYSDVFKFDTLVVGSPTYNNDIFPSVRHFLYGVCSRMVRNHKFASFGSYSWVGGSVKMMNEMASSHGFQVMSQGMAFKQGYTPEKCNVSAFADEILQ